MLEALVFVGATAGLAYISRGPLQRARTRDPIAHGFYRFFAWESLLLLFLLNMRVWFLRPFSFHQIVSWSFLTASLCLLLPGVNLLRRQGRPADRRADPTLVGIEKTTALVTTGIYRHIRHPLYSSLLFLGWGLFFKRPTWRTALLALVTTAFLLQTARVEEDENILFFGDAYRQYMQRTKMFVPFLL